MLRTKGRAIGPGTGPESSSRPFGYLAHWLQVLKQDKRAIFTAAAAAQTAADTLHALQVAEPGQLAA